MAITIKMCIRDRPDTDPNETNVYDMRLTAHEDGWIYGIFCSESLDPNAVPGDLSSAIAKAGIVRTKDLKNWERLPNLISKNQQRNVVLHPEFVNGKYALYTRPQDSFIDAGNGGGIGWTLIDDITHAEIKKETIINYRHYHTIKEVKNGEGPHPIKTPKGWLHLAHGAVSYTHLYGSGYDERLVAFPQRYSYFRPGERYRMGYLCRHQPSEPLCNL